MTRSSRLFNSGVIPKPRVFSSEARNLPFELLRPFRAYRFASVFRCAPCVFLFYMSQFFLPTANPPTKQCFTMSTLPREPPLESQVIFTPPAPHRATQPRRPRFRSKAFSRDRPPHQRRRRHRRPFRLPGSSANSSRESCGLYRFNAAARLFIIVRRGCWPGVV